MTTILGAPIALRKNSDPEIIPELVEEFLHRNFTASEMAAGSGTKALRHQFARRALGMGLRRYVDKNGGGFQKEPYLVIVVSTVLCQRARRSVG